MPFPCDKCKRAGAVCSGLEGERCGRCRAIRKPCSHNTQPRPSVSKSDPPGAKIIVPVSVFALERDPVGLSAKKERDVAPSRRPTSGPTVGENIKLKLKLGRTSTTFNGMFLLRSMLFRAFG